MTLQPTIIFRLFLFSCGTVVEYNSLGLTTCNQQANSGECAVTDYKLGGFCFHHVQVESSVQGIRADHLQHQEFDDMVRLCFITCASTIPGGVYLKVDIYLMDDLSGFW